jgi:hypothetical protein
LSYLYLANLCLLFVTDNGSIWVSIPEAELMIASEKFCVTYNSMLDKVQESRFWKINFNFLGTKFMYISAENMYLAKPCIKSQKMTSWKHKYQFSLDPSYNYHFRFQWHIRHSAIVNHENVLRHWNKCNIHLNHADCLSRLDTFSYIPCFMILPFVKATSLHCTAVDICPETVVWEIYSESYFFYKLHTTFFQILDLLAFGVLHVD